jgi:hypothetical protein
VFATAHIQDADLDSYLHNRVDSTSAFGIQSHIRKCSTCEKRLISLTIAQLAELTGEQRGGNPEQRKNQRLQTGEFGRLRALYPLSYQQLDIQIINITRNGFGLLTTTLLQSGTIVEIRTGTNVSLGEVRYCRSLEGGEFHAGIQMRTPEKAASLMKKT